MKTILTDKKGKTLPQEKLNEYTDEYKEKHSQNQEYNLGYLHGRLAEEDRTILSNMMADGLFFGIYLANTYGIKIKYKVEDKTREEVNMYG